MANRRTAQDEGRRRFLDQTLLATTGLILVQSPLEVQAAASDDDNSKLKTSSNRKMGGLTNRIRNIANVMVRNIIR